MSIRILTVGVAALVWAVPVTAQQRGTVEFGAFGSAGKFDKTLTLDRGVGVGGRVGVFLHPRFALEFEKGEMRATRTLGLKDVNVGILSGRAVGTIMQGGSLSIVLGAGAGGSTETNFLHSYDLSGLLGAKIALGNRAAFRVDLISAWLANDDWKSYQSLHAGFSLFRNPHNNVRVRTVEVQGPTTTVVQRTDSVSGHEMARLRQAERDFRSLRDSLRTSQPVKLTQPAPIKTEKERRP